jgi:DNA-directed RNA polymerase specialized sigma24 family protein
MGATLQQDRCAANDYVRLFADSASSLRWLCCTLTGNDELSEKILSAALEHSLKGAERVFRDWMLGWARRLVIRACIELTKPWSELFSQSTYPLPPMILDSVNRDHLAELADLPADLLQQALLRQDSLSRFVFVLRALEGYSRRDTALLLNLDDRTCEWIYVRAVSALHNGAQQEVFWKSGWTPEIDYSVAQAGD